MARRSKRSSRPGEPLPWGKIFKILGVLVLIVVVLGGAYGLALLGPKPVEYTGPEFQSDLDVPKDVSALLDQSKELERQVLEKDPDHLVPPKDLQTFLMRKEVSDPLKSLGEKVTPDDLDKLQQAIDLQHQYLVKSFNHNLAEGNARVDEMTNLFQYFQSVPLRAQSLDLEQRAKLAQDKQDINGARDLYLQAAALEDKIVHDDAQSPLRIDADARSVLLNHRARYLIALPLNDESLAAEAAAKAALQRQDWAAAQQNFQKARDLQEQLNRDFTDQEFENPGRLVELGQELLALRSLPQHDDIARLVADGHAADAKGDYLLAADLFQQAQRQQRDLIANFKDSRFADPAVVDQIEVFRESALSRPLANEIQTQAQALADNLRKRQDQPVADEVAVLTSKVENFRENFPRSALIDDEVQQRIEFLNSKRQDLAAIQDQVYAQLLPIPGLDHLLLYKQEVPQALYQAVADSNPSRNPGDTLPVESINWDEAQEFCRRLSWILSRPVRLPTVAQFRAALGATDALDPMAGAWNLDNSQGVTRPVSTKNANAGGFYDLLGNVAEWLERTPDNQPDEAPVIGGNVQTPVDSLRAVPLANLPVTDRNRFTGFRFVVNTDDSAPLLPPTPPPDSSSAPAFPTAAPTPSAPTTPAPSTPAPTSGNSSAPASPTSN